MYEHTANTRNSGPGFPAPGFRTRDSVCGLRNEVHREPDGQLVGNKAKKASTISVLKVFRIILDATSFPTNQLLYNATTKPFLYV